MAPGSARLFLVLVLLGLEVTSALQLAKHLGLSYGAPEGTYECLDPLCISHGSQSIMSILPSQGEGTACVYGHADPGIKVVVRVDGQQDGGTLAEGDTGAFVYCLKSRGAGGPHQVSLTRLGSRGSLAGDGS